MYRPALPYPAPTSLAGFLLGIIIMAIIDVLLHILFPFFSLASYAIMFTSFICILFVLSLIVLPRLIVHYSSYANRGRDLDPDGYRPNLTIALCLGGVFIFGLLMAIHSFLELRYPRVVWPFGLYLSFLAFFHWSEFFLAALTNPGRADIDLYLLDHSPEYLCAAIASFLEYWVEVFLWPAKTTSFLVVNFTGFIICLSGEAFRKAAMWTAADNFSHYIERTRRQEHRLVRSGVYKVCRHPAYAGWFFFSLGTQLLLVNPICSIAYPVAAYLFFRDRVYSEERCLVAFFGDEYRAYQLEVPTGLPFIHGYARL